MWRSCQTETTAKAKTLRPQGAWYVCGTEKKADVANECWRIADSGKDDR